MNNYRKYGNPPFTVSVLHGGPGVSGDMAPVARELSSIKGIIEPLQTKATLDAQVLELKGVIENEAAPPINIIGWSWGAWLGFIFAAQYPELVQKLILIGSGAFEEKYAININETRLNRLSDDERAEILSIMNILDNPCTENKDSLFTRMGDLISKADAYDALPHQSETLECSYSVFHYVWPQGNELRKSGKLLELGKNIQCPVVAIQGDYDPHIADGVKGPLSRVLSDFRFILLEKCGHQPWNERAARDNFYEILKKEISGA